MIKTDCPVLGFVAWSGSGKTTLLKKLIPILNKKSVRVALIKHAHHDFDIDYPGKDSYELRKAGATKVIIASQKRWAMIHDTPDNKHDVSLQSMLDRFSQTELDLILVEGFKHEHFPKIEIHRSAINKPMLYPDDQDIIAIASDTPLDTKAALTVLDINNITDISSFIMRMLDAGRSYQV